MPKNYSDGERVYTPPDLKSFNFPKFILLNYLYIAFSDPRNFIYMLTLISPAMIVKKLFKNIVNLIKHFINPNRLYKILKNKELDYQEIHTLLHHGMGIILMVL